MTESTFDPSMRRELAHGRAMSEESGDESNGFDSVLVMSFGGPSSVEEIQPFLEDVFNGKSVPPDVFERTTDKYRTIGGGSPITAVTRAQAADLEAVLARDGFPVPVHVGMRHWSPLIRDTLPRMTADGARRVLGIPMVAHRSEASSGRYVSEVEAILKEMGVNAPVVEYPPAWHDDPLFIEAICDRVKEALERVPDGEPVSEIPWVFTAHSIPLEQARASTYVQDVSRTIELVAERFSPLRWRLGYQSRSGPLQMPWLGPDVHEAIREEAGVRRVLVVPIGFVSDNVEVLYDLDHAAAATAREARVGYLRAGTVGDHPAFIRMLANLVTGSK